MHVWGGLGVGMCEGVCVGEKKKCKVQTELGFWSHPVYPRDHVLSYQAVLPKRPSVPESHIHRPHLNISSDRYLTRC